MLTLTLLLLVLALVAVVANVADGRTPLWLAVLLVVLALLIGHVPIR